MQELREFLKQDLNEMYSNFHRVSILIWTLACIRSSRYAQTCPVKCRCNAEYRTVDCSPTSTYAIRMREIPKDIPRDTLSLNLSNNRFGWLRNTSFPFLPELQKLYMFRCKVKRIDSGVFMNMSRLTFLDLSGNKLRDYTYVKLSSLESLHWLQTLNLSGSHLTPTILNSIKSKSLQTLDLSRNRITDLFFGDCFQTQSALSYISFSGNPVTSFNATAFENLQNSPLKELRLDSCNLVAIPHSAFKPLKHLRTLCLANNPVRWRKADFDAVMESLCGAPLRNLDLQNSSVSSIAGSFSCFDDLVSLDLTSNTIQRIENGTFVSNNRLETLSLAYNKILNVDDGALEGLRSLRNISFENNRMSQIPCFSDAHGMSYVPMVRQLSLVRNVIADVKKVKPIISAFIGLENLQVLQIGYNHLHYLDEMSLTPLRKLTALEAGGNLMTSISRTTFWNMSQLVRIDLTNNKFLLQNDGYFKGLKKLDEILLGRNDFSEFDYWPSRKAPSPIEIFSDLRSLRKLNLNYVNLKYLHDGFFAALKNLTKLILDGNGFSGWSPRAFQYLVSLQHLSIINCQVFTINSSMLQPVRATLTRFEGYGNPFACECKLRWFISWLEMMNSSSNASTHVLRKPYKCLTPKKWHGHSIFEYGRNTTDDDCSDFNWLLITATASGTVVFVTAAISGIAYYHRWSIRYWMFLARSRRKKEISLRRREDFEYDCFVTYSSLDTDFVVQEMLSHLEGENDLRVCIHERNFQVGGDITDNIVQSIETSRKIVVVLTENYVKSEWCKLELNMAHAKLLDERLSRQALIIIMKEKVSVKLMTPILRHLVRNQTYILWNGSDVILQTAFWGKLVQAIMCDVKGYDDP